MTNLLPAAPVTRDVGDIETSSTYQMITDIPQPEDFEKQSTQNLFQAIYMIFERDIGIEGEEEKNKYWQYYQGALQTSLTLLFLGLENYLKSKICSVSPLLLLADEPRKWKAGNNSKSFNDLYIHSFDNLLALYQELNLGDISSSTSDKLEQLRKERNKITHGLTKNNISPKDMLDILHILMTEIWKNGEGWRILQDYIIKQPYYDIDDEDVNKADSTHYINFIQTYIGKIKTGEILGIDLKQRNYYCPSCHYWLNRDYDGGESKFAILSPNKPDSTTLYCPICNERFTIKREKCFDQSCKGNVIYENNQCLTCFQYPEDR